MRTFLFPLLMLAAAPALAQTQTPEQAQAAAILMPMMAEVSPKDGGILAGCVVAVATPEEIAQIDAAGVPTPALGPLVSAILARPEALACIQANVPG